MLSNRKMKVDKANIIGSSNPDSGARQARVRAGNNITIIKANSTSVPPSPGFQYGLPSSRGASPLTSVSNSSRNSRANFPEQSQRPHGRISPSSPFILANVVERRTSRASIHPSDCTNIRSLNSLSPTLVQLPLPSLTQTALSLEPDTISDDKSDADSELSEATHATHSSKANSSHSDKTDDSSQSGNSMASDISSSYAVEARVNRKVGFIFSPRIIFVSNLNIDPRSRDIK